MMGDPSLSDGKDIDSIAVIVVNKDVVYPCFRFFRDREGVMTCGVFTQDPAIAIYLHRHAVCKKELAAERKEAAAAKKEAAAARKEAKAAAAAAAEVETEAPAEEPAEAPAKKTAAKKPATKKVPTKKK